MPNYRAISLSCILGIALFFCAGCSSFYDAKADSSQQVQSSSSLDAPSSSDSQVVQSDEPLILGDSSRAGASNMDCLNSTGQEISAFYIKLSSQDMYNKNLMPAGKVWEDNSHATVFFNASSQKSESTGNATIDMSGVFSGGGGFEILDLNPAEMKNPNLEILDGAVAIGYIDQSGNAQFVKSTGY
jgi:hypothetical protein